MIVEELKNIIEKALKNAGFDSGEGILVEQTEKREFGDYYTNIALVLSKKLNKNPKETAESIAKNIESDVISKVEVAGPGFINFFISDKVFIDNLKSIDKNVGRNVELKGKKVILDYTDPNPFKEFHIGHLMSNAIGESLSRLFEFQGAKVKRVCYQGDVGIHVAKAIWGKMKYRDKSWGEAYALGSKAYDESTKEEIIELNKKIYKRSDREISKLYDEGKKESLKHFSELYKKLDTNFDYYIFESEVSDLGKKIVEDGLKKGIFEKSQGAIVFKGEKCGLHTRVFINSEGLPTYEAKDLALADAKYKKYSYDSSVIVTANEQNEYFKVMLCAMKEINPELAIKTKHIGHGMLRLPEGKMSSRTGKVITGESLIEKVEELVKEKIHPVKSAKGGVPLKAGQFNQVKDRGFSEEETKEIMEKVAVGAIRYSILKQSIGSDIIYDFDKSISFEGDSGPYLEYSYTRAVSVLRKAKEEGVKPSFRKAPDSITELEKAIYGFSDVVLRAGNNYEPHYLVSYLTELAGTFNNYYSKNKIVDKNDEFSSYKVALVNAFSLVMKNGLWLLGINHLDKM